MRDPSSVMGGSLFQRPRTDDAPLTDVTEDQTHEAYQASETGTVVGQGTIGTPAVAGVLLGLALLIVAGYNAFAPILPGGAAWSLALGPLGLALCVCILSRTD